MKPECSLISCSDWDKKYGKEYGEITEIKEHSFGIKDAFIDNLDRKLSSLMSTKLQFVKQESAGNNSTRYDYTYLDGAVKLTLVEKYGFVTMVNTSTEISMEKTAKDNETQLWTGIVNTCYFPIAVFENYSDKDKVCETFLNNYSKDAKGTITVSGDSYTATLYDNGIDGTLVSFLPK